MCAWPQSLEPLRGLQRALAKSAQPLSASSIAAEATMQLQQQQPQQQQQQQLENQGPGQPGLSTSAPQPSVQPQGQQGMAQDVRSTATNGRGGASAPLNGHAAAAGAQAAFASQSTEQVVAVTLRVANALLGGQTQAAPAPAFLLDLVRTPPPAGQEPARSQVRERGERVLH